MRAASALEAHQDDKACEFLRGSLRLRPEDAAARQKLASLELAKGDWEVALLDLQQTQEFAPDDAEPLVATAKLMVEKGWLEAPELALDRALELSPGRVDARKLRAGIRLALGRYYAAQQDADPTLQPALEKIQRGEPAPARAGPRGTRLDGHEGSSRREQWAGRLGDLRDRLDVSLRQQSFDEAASLVADAARLAPGTAFPPFMRGVLELAHGTGEAAEQEFTAALAEAPRSSVIAGSLGRAWAKQGGAAFAANRLMQLAERDPHFAAARYLAARAFVEAGDPIKAEGALRRGLQLQPGSPVPYRHLTDYYFGLDRASEALEICLQGGDRFPKDISLRMMRAQIEAASGRTSEAIQIYQQLAAERPDLDSVQYKLASLLAAGREDDPRLLEVVRKLKFDQPTDPQLSDALGWLLLKAGETARAKERLEAAVRDLPAAPGPRYHLAVLDARLGDREQAQRELQAVLGSQQPFAERLDAMRLLRETAPK